MNFGVIQFPGSNCDQDAYHALVDVLGQSTRYIWHKDTTLGDIDCVVIPGGFSYGDYLRTGAIARFSPAMKAVITHAELGALCAALLALANDRGGHDNATLVVARLGAAAER